MIAERLDTGLTGLDTTHIMFGAPEVNHVNIILGLVQQSPQGTTDSLIGHLSGGKYLALMMVLMVLVLVLFEVLLVIVCWCC